MKSLRMLVCLFAIVTLVVSCQEEVGTGTLKVMMHCDIAKTIAVDNSSLDVVKYTVSGTGPGGKNFCVDSTSSSVTLDGIVLGNWDIRAVAYNMNSKAIAEGSCKVDFNQASQTVSLSLDSNSGSGSLQIKFTWDEEVANPVLDIWLYGPDSSVMFSKTVEAGLERTYYTLSLSQIPTGTYGLKVILKNSSTKVGGLYEAVRITSGDKTGKTLSFCHDELWPGELETLHVVTETSQPITGHIEGLPSISPSGENKVISLILDSAERSLEGYCIRWFLDGEEVGNPGALLRENTQTFRFSNGSHILNVIVYNTKINTVGSAGMKFTAKPIAKKGVPVFNSSVSGSQALLLDCDTMVSALPKQRFLIYTPSECALQLCKVYNDKIVVIKTFTSAFEGFSWIENGNGLFSDNRMNLFAITDGENNVNILTYINEEDTVEISTYEGELQRYEGVEPTTNIPIGIMGFVKPSPSPNGALFICDKTRRTLIHPSSADNMTITNKGVSMKPGELRELSQLDVSSSLIMAISPDDSTIWYSKYENRTVNTNWDSFTSRISKPEKILLLNRENVLIAGDGIICKYTKYSSSGWSWAQTVQVDCSLWTSSNDGNFIYVLSKDNDLITYSALSGRLVKLSSFHIDDEVSSLVLNENDLIAVTPFGKLILFTIAQEGNL